MNITDENLIIHHGGGKAPGAGIQRHYPIFKDGAGVEHISLNGLTLVKISSLQLNKHSRRERVKRTGNS